MPCYRIPLRDFTTLAPPFAREQFLDQPEIRKRLIDIRRAHSNLFYDPISIFNKAAISPRFPNSSLACWMMSTIPKPAATMICGMRPMRAPELPAAPIQPKCPARNNPKYRDTSGCTRRVPRRLIGMNFGMRVSRGLDGTTSAT